MNAKPIKASAFVRLHPLPDADFSRKLRGLMFSRVLFAFLLFASTLIYQSGEGRFSEIQPVIMLLALSLAIFLISIVYYALFRFAKTHVLFVYFQLAVDSLFVTLIVLVTGGFYSAFIFLYLLVILCAGMFLPIRGILLIAVICSAQYVAMVGLDLLGFFESFGLEADLADVEGGRIILKIVTITAACLAVGWLSGILSEQEQKTKSELKALESHLKRVERMAAIGEMAAGMAHEIKNPLASLAGSIQLLREESRFDADQDKLMKIILREADRLNRLVHDFLLFAKPKATRLATIHLNEALSEIVALFEKDQSRRDLVDIHTLYGGDFWVQMDPDHFHQIIWNLLLNAAQAIQETGTIEIRLYPLKSGFVGIDVEDNGCGMSEQTLTDIFNPFYTTRPSGSGLGLSIVHQILAAYDGQVDVSSKVGQGTCFTLKLKQVPPPSKN